MASHHLPALGNAAPFHLLTQASVEELNRKIPDLKTPITALNFRLTHTYFLTPSGAEGVAMSVKVFIMYKQTEPQILRLVDKEGHYLFVSLSDPILW